MRKLVRSRNAWIALVLLAGFWGFPPLVDNRTLGTIIQGMTMMVSLMVVLSFAPLTWQALRMGHIPRDLHLVMGIECAWLGSFLRATYIVVYRMMYEGSIDSYFVTFTNLMIFYGAVLHLTAPSMDVRDKIPKKTWLVVAAAITAGLMVSFVLLMFQIHD